MINFNLTAADLPEVLRDIEGLDDLVLDEMAATMRRSIDVLEAAVAQRTPVGATGNLRSAWGTNVERGVAAIKGTLANPMQYAPDVEKGQEPGRWPNPAALELWVQRKLGIQPPRSEQVAFLIGRAIHARGTKGAHMAEEGLAAVKGQIVADFDGVPARVARRANL
jgi:hypothetical protein